MQTLVPSGAARLGLPPHAKGIFNGSTHFANANDFALMAGHILYRGLVRLTGACSDATHFVRCFLAGIWLMLAMRPSKN
jgi:hypothetical protein